jgi:hypothetical protein
MSDERPMRVVNPVQFFGPGESWSAERVTDDVRIVPEKAVVETPEPEPEPEEAPSSLPDPPDDGDDEPDDPPSEEDGQLGLLDDPAADD